MDDFATLFTYLVLGLTGFSFAALAGFIAWDAVADARRSRRSNKPQLPAATDVALPHDWIQPSKAA